MKRERETWEFIERDLMERERKKEKGRKRGEREREKRRDIKSFKERKQIHTLEQL